MVNTPLLNSDPAAVRSWALARVCSPIVFIAGAICLLAFFPRALLPWTLIVGLGLWVVNAYTDRIACPSCGHAYFTRPSQAFGVRLTHRVFFARSCANCGETPAV